MYLLDTNVCIKFLNKRSPLLVKRLKEKDSDEIFLCSIVKAELFYGANKSNNPQRALEIQKDFCSMFHSLPFDDISADAYGRIRANLEKEGKIIGPNDLIIAAIAVANDLTLVTNNSREFSRVKGLKYEDWEVE